MNPTRSRFHPSRRFMRYLIVVALITGGMHLSNAQQIPRAEVVDEDPSRVPRAVPVGPDGRPLRGEVVDERPKGPDEDLFAYGTMLYERDEYALALKAYGDYIKSYPSGARMPTVMFRMGECWVKQGKETESARYFEDVVKRYPKSEGAPASSYRLGAIHFNARDFEKSASYFAFCEKNSPVEQVRLAAAYNMSRAYQMMGDLKGQRAALERVIAIKKDNPYREAALSTLAKSDLKGNQLEPALKRFLDLVDSATDKALQTEAMVNAGVLLGELKRPDESLEMFERALSSPELKGENRGIALVGVVQALYAKNDYDAIIDQYTRNSAILPTGKSRGKMLLMVGNAYRMKKNYARAVEVYLLVEQDFPSDDVAFEAGYWKLYCFYLLEDEDLAAFANGYLSRWSKLKADHEFLAKAALIRADHYFNRGQFAEAANAFSEVTMDALSEKIRANALFNKGYSLLESKRAQEAIGTFSRFLSENPDHELVSNALAHRGIAYREAKDLANAKQDFTKVTEQYARSPAAEMAWYQLGLIAGIERDPTERIRTFESLIKWFPQSQAVSQAWFGVGSAAYEREDWPKAQEALQKAIRLDPERYLDSASQMLVMTFYAQEDANGLAEAIDNYRAKNAEALIPPNVLAWLGLSLFSTQDFKGAAKYLALASTPDEPANTQPAVWNYLGMAQVETNTFKPAIQSLNHFLEVSIQPGAERGKALYYRARAELGLGEDEQALATADEALGFIKTGRLHADLLILEGDILFQRALNLEKAGNRAASLSEFRAAAAKYIVPSQFFVDPKVTPLAVWKTILALEKAEEDDRAKVLRRELEQKYPDFDPANT